MKYKNASVLLLMLLVMTFPGSSNAQGRLSSVFDTVSLVAGLMRGNIDPPLMQGITERSPGVLSTVGNMESHPSGNSSQSEGQVSTGVLPSDAGQPSGAVAFGETTATHNTVSPVTTAQNPQINPRSGTLVNSETQHFTLEQIQTLKAGYWKVYPIFSPNGNYLVTGSSRPHAVHIWENVGGQWQLHESIPHSQRIDRVRFSPDGVNLVTHSEDGTAQIWGIVNGRWQQRAIVRHAARVRSAIFSPDGTYLATRADDGSAQIWGLVGGEWQRIAVFNHSETSETSETSEASGDSDDSDDSDDSEDIVDISFSPDGNYFAMVSAGADVQIRQLIDGQWQVTDTINIRQSRWVIRARFSPDGIHLAIATSDGQVMIWECVDRRWHLRATAHHAGPVMEIRFSRDGTHLVTSALDDTSQIWSLSNGQWQLKAIAELPAPVPEHCGGRVNAFFSPNGNHLVITADRRDPIIYTLVNGEWQKTALNNYNHGCAEYASFSPDSTLLVIGHSGYYDISLWRLVNGQWQLQDTIEQLGEARSVHFSPDGSFIVSHCLNAHAAIIWKLNHRAMD